MRCSPARRMNLARRVLFFVSGIPTCGQSVCNRSRRGLRSAERPNDAKHMEQLLEQYGCVGLEGFLRVTHALSATSSKSSQKGS